MAAFKKNSPGCNSNPDCGCGNSDSCSRLLCDSGVELLDVIYVGITASDSNFPPCAHPVAQVRKMYLVPDSAGGACSYIGTFLADDGNCWPMQFRPGACGGGDCRAEFQTGGAGLGTELDSADALWQRTDIPATDGGKHDCADSFGITFTSADINTIDTCFSGANLTSTLSISGSGTETDVCGDVLVEDALSHWFIGCNGCSVGGSNRFVSRSSDSTYLVGKIYRLSDGTCAEYQGFIEAPGEAGLTVADGPFDDCTACAPACTCYGTYTVGGVTKTDYITRLIFTVPTGLSISSDFDPHGCPLIQTFWADHISGLVYAPVDAPPFNCGGEGSGPASSFDPGSPPTEDCINTADDLHLRMTWQISDDGTPGQCRVDAEFGLYGPVYNGGVAIDHGFFYINKNAPILASYPMQMTHPYPVFSLTATLVNVQIDGFTC